MRINKKSERKKEEKIDHNTSCLVFEAKNLKRISLYFKSIVLVPLMFFDKVAEFTGDFYFPCLIKARFASSAYKRTRH